MQFLIICYSFCQIQEMSLTFYASADAHCCRLRIQRRHWISPKAANSHRHRGQRRLASDSYSRLLGPREFALPFVWDWGARWKISSSFFPSLLFRVFLSDWKEFLKSWRKVDMKYLKCRHRISISRIGSFRSTFQCNVLMSFVSAKLLYYANDNKLFLSTTIPFNDHLF